jgi:hypothetical protein
MKFILMNLFIFAISTSAHAVTVVFCSEKAATQLEAITLLNDSLIH